MKIQTQELQVSFGDAKILQGISIQMEEKKILGIIGPNGSGKSTFLKCIYRVIKPQGGVVYLDGSALQELPVKDTARKMAVVAQHNEQSFDFTVLEMVLMGRSPHKKFLERDSKEDLDIAEEALEKVGMQDFATRSFNSLSGGEKQRIILARALAQKTKCLILDEPTNHLDIRYQLQFMEIAKELRITIVAAIHDLNIAAMYCDYLFALKEGQVFAQGTPGEILTPEMIQKLYGVKAKVFQEDQRMRIFYTALA